MAAPTKHLILALATLLAALSPAASVWAEESVTLLYNERPPFMKSNPDGTASGTAAGPAGEAFRQAGIQIDWAMVPPPRQLLMLQENKSRVCAVGRYKTAERQSFAKYTKPVSQDTPMVALANPRLRLKAGIGFAELLALEDPVVLIKQGIFYGPSMEPAFAAMKAKRLMTSEDYGPMVEMLRAGKADVTFFPAEEAEYYVRTFKLGPSEIGVVRFPEMPPGERRYIMCDMMVEDSVIARVNAHIHGPNG